MSEQTPSTPGRDVTIYEVGPRDGLQNEAALVPLTYFKVLLYRPANFTNLVSSAAWSGQYDYLNIGTTKK